MTTDYSLRANRLRHSERGAALATAILMLALLSCIALTVLAVVQTETKVAGSDLDRTQAFYAAAAGIEKMTSDFSTLFARTSRPTTTQMNNIAAAPPDLAGEGFTFNQSIVPDDVTLAAMQLTQGITNGAYPTVTVQDGPLVGLTASVAPYILNTTATSSSAQVNLKRTMNNYLVPIFQFGMFSDEDMEIHPGPNFTFNGRVHANGNLYLNGNVTFLDKVTTASEVVRDVLRNGATHDGIVNFDSGPLAIGSASVVLGPNVAGSSPTSPTGTLNATWTSNSVAAFSGQLLSRTTGIAPLMLPLQLDGNQTREIIKRRMPNDDLTLSDSRYHSKSEIRILIDDEGTSAGDASGIPSNKGVKLSVTDTADTYYFKPKRLDGGRALYRISDSGNYTDSATTAPLQGASGNVADTVRNIRNPATADTSSSGRTIPGGADIGGRILIEIVKVSGTTTTTYDVTKDVLSMGMTEGEPNAIVHLQRPLWAAFTQGSRDSSNSTNPAFNGDPSYTNSLTDITSKTRIGADGEIQIVANANPALEIPLQNTTYGFLTKLLDDTASGAQPTRSNTPGAVGTWNSIVPINVYNVREGRINNDSFAANTMYERGMTSVIEVNMRNLARWLDGVYDGNLLSGTNAVSGNISCPDGYIVYVSDRRGDKTKSEVDTAGITLSTTNGTVDNEDIYGPIGGTTYTAVLNPGEDVIDFGTKKNALQHDITELSDPLPSNVVVGTVGVVANPVLIADRTDRAKVAARWTNPNNLFRRAVRLFNGEDLQLTGGANKLSITKGITVASENMVYIWGNFNTTGIDSAPPAGQSCLNEDPAPCLYTGDQVPTSIVCDAIFPLSKNWFDATSTMYADNVGNRVGDRNLGGDVTLETSVRAGIIAGNNLSALSAPATGPDAGNYDTNPNNNESRLNGGMHNFPRFLEAWAGRFNMVGSLIPLYHSTQAVGQYNASSSIYSPPVRNWAFDSTFRRPDRLPPGTPQFQYIEPTAFRQVLY
jgi:Tfp pilus assembly protein PilX